MLLTRIVLSTDGKGTAAIEASIVGPIHPQVYAYNSLFTIIRARGISVVRLICR